MDWFFLQPFSLLALTQAILAFFALLYFVRLNNKSRATWMLVLALSGLMLLWVNEFVKLSSTFNNGSVTAILGTLLLFGFLHFAYAFLENPFPQEARYMFRSTLAILAGFTLYHMVLLVRSADAMPAVFIAQELFNVTLIVWAGLVLLRKRRRVFREEEGGHRKARAFGAFALLLLAIIPLSLRTIWGTTNTTDLWVDSIQYIGFAVLLGAFVVIYINHSLMPTTFMVKLVGLSLATVLIILALTSLVLYPDSALRDASRAGLPALHSIRFEPDEKGGYRYAHLPLELDTNRGADMNLAVEGDSLVSLGFSFPFFGKEWDAMYIDSNGLVTFEAPYTATQFRHFFDATQPKIAPYYRALIPMSSGRSGVYYRSDPNKVIVTWYRVRERYDKDPGNENSFQLVLYRSGAIDFVYDTMEAQSLYGYRGLYPGGEKASMESVHLTTTSEEAITQDLLPQGATIRFEPDAQDAYQFAKMEAAFDADFGSHLQVGNRDDITVSLGFAFPFFGESHDSIIVTDNGVVSMEQSIYSSANAWFNPHDTIYEKMSIIAPLFDDLNPLQQGGVFFNAKSDKAVITWRDIPRFGSDLTNTVQLALYPDGMIDFTYEAIGMSDFAADLWGLYSAGGHAPINATRYLMKTGSTTVAPGAGVYEDLGSTEELAFLRYRHARVLPFFYLILGCSFLIVVIFPLFFRYSLVRPLAALLDGVHRVDAGDFEAHVPVQANDEIGVLTHKFNSMAASLKFAKEREIERWILESEMARKTKELEQARALQLSILPSELPKTPDFEIDVFMKTATEVGGDYYDFHLAEDGILTVAIGDATGHGIKAGMMVVIAKSLFSAAVLERDILPFFEQSTRTLKHMRLGNLFLGLTLMRIKDDRITFSAAGMPPLLIYRAQTGEVELITLKGMPLGAFLNFPYQQHETGLSTGDVILLMTDGLQELFNEEREMFGLSRIESVFKQVATKSPKEIIKNLEDAGESWQWSQDDDITFVVLKRT